MRLLIFFFEREITLDNWFIWLFVGEKTLGLMASDGVLILIASGCFLLSKIVPLKEARLIDF